MTVMAGEDDDYIPPGGVVSAAMSPAGVAVNGGVDTVSNTGSNPNKRKKPDFSMEWKDLKIEIKVYGKDIEEEDQEYLELFPNISQDILSSQCIEDKKDVRRTRPSSRYGHTLTDLLENRGALVEDDDDDNEEDRSPSRSPTKSPNKIQKDNQDGVDDMYTIKHLITLPSGEKKCHICGKVFPDFTKQAEDARSSALKQQLRRRIKRHLIAHSGKKPFSCNLCGWGFFQKCNLERHMSSHSKEGEGEECPHCHCWFTTKSVLSLHMKERHNDRLITKKEQEIQINRMKREIEDKKKQAERNEALRKIRALNERRLQLQAQQGGVGNQISPGARPGPGGGSLHLPPAVQPGSKTSFVQHSIFHAQAQGVEGGMTQATREEIARSNNKCHICGKTFVKKTNLKHHLMLHRGEKPWKCSLCEWRFVQKCNLKKHMQSHTDGAFACPVCNIKFSSKGSVSTHLYRVHKDNLPENYYLPSEEEIPPPPGQSNQQPDKPVGNLWWKELEGNQEDSKPVSGAGSGPAPTPPSQNQSMSNLKAALNMPQKKPPSQPPVTCQKCGKMFLTPAHLQKHMLVHNAGVKPYACPVCGCRFHLHHNLKRHVHNHEQQGDIEAGTSDSLISAAESKTAQATTVMLQQKTGLLSRSGPVQRTGVVVDNKGNMKCNICNLWFQSAAELGAHMEIHDRMQPHVCNICGWRFKQIQNLKRHMHTHTGIKPFSCDFCDKGYTDAYTLKMHLQKSHPGVASTLPSLQIPPRGKEFTSEEAGFQNMIAQMQNKEDAVKAYQARFQNESESVSVSDLVLEPDINMFSPDDDLVDQDYDPVFEKSVKDINKDESKNDAVDIQDILDMDDEDEEIVEELETEAPSALNIQAEVSNDSKQDKSSIANLAKTNTAILGESKTANLNNSTVEEEEDINMSGDLEDDLGEEDFDEEITEVDPVQKPGQGLLNKSTNYESEGLLIEPASDPAIDNVDGGDGFPVIDSVDGDVSMEDIGLEEESVPVKKDSVEEQDHIVEENKSVEHSTGKEANDSVTEGAEVDNSLKVNDDDNDVDTTADMDTTADVIDHDFDAELQKLEAQVMEEDEKSKITEDSTDKSATNEDTVKIGVSNEETNISDNSNEERIKTADSNEDSTVKDASDEDNAVKDTQDNKN